MKIHVVQKGDTLWELAKKYGVDFSELKKANHQLADPDQIMPGMKIKIPTSTKQVVKETVPDKVMHPYQDTSKKAHPVIKEDDKKEKKQVKKQMPQKEMPIPKPPSKPIQLPKLPNIYSNHYNIDLGIEDNDFSFNQQTIDQTNQTINYQSKEKVEKKPEKQPTLPPVTAPKLPPMPPMGPMMPFYCCMPYPFPFHPAPVHPPVAPQQDLCDTYAKPDCSCSEVKHDHGKKADHLQGHPYQPMPMQPLGQWQPNASQMTHQSPVDWSSHQFKDPVHPHDYEHDNEGHGFIPYNNDEYEENTDNLAQDPNFAGMPPYPMMDPQMGLGQQGYPMMPPQMGPGQQDFPMTDPQMGPGQQGFPMMPPQMGPGQQGFPMMDPQMGPGQQGFPMMSPQMGPGQQGFPMMDPQMGPGQQGFPMMPSQMGPGHHAFPGDPNMGGMPHHGMPPFGSGPPFRDEEGTEE
ncbi:morphogenetic protein associated with SpoVID [Natronobacillus azotifigens]|uniref:SafA/ExsA family spore coat assembly protein n=1 Tax=Natronobacillus azotifigens TaxID=472978 RepID=UPI00300DE412